MKNMFYKYDNYLNAKEAPVLHCPQDDRKILENNPNVSIVRDVKGNEIGIRVHHLGSFTLYFSLCSCDQETLAEMIAEGSEHFILTLFDAQHQPLVSTDDYNYDPIITTDYLKGQVTATFTRKQCDLLKNRIYTMRLEYIPDSGSALILFCENDGFLSVL